jgi:hypothetical protein
VGAFLTTAGSGLAASNATNLCKGPTANNVVMKVGTKNVTVVPMINDAKFTKIALPTFANKTLMVTGKYSIIEAFVKVPATIYSGAVANQNALNGKDNPTNLVSLIMIGQEGVVVNSSAFNIQTNNSKVQLTQTAASHVASGYIAFNPTKAFHVAWIFAFGNVYTLFNGTVYSNTTLSDATDDAHGLQRATTAYSAHPTGSVLNAIHNTSTTVYQLNVAIGVEIPATGDSANKTPYGISAATKKYSKYTAPVMATDGLKTSKITSANGLVLAAVCCKDGKDTCPTSISGA